MLAYRDSLPPDQRHVQSKPDEPKKPIQMFHIPKGALDDKPYMFGGAPENTTSKGIVQSFQETGQRIEKVDVSPADISDRMHVRNNLQKQVFQPWWNQPTMTGEQCGDVEYE